MLYSNEILLFTRELVRLVHDYNHCLDPEVKEIIGNEIDKLNLILEQLNSRAKPLLKSHSKNIANKASFLTYV